MCTAHYQRHRTGKPLDAPLRSYAYQGETCSVDGCDNPPHAHTLCGMHHQRALRHATPLRTPPTMEERFWSSVDTSGGPDACWPWTGRLSAQGYGRFSASHTEERNAHVISYTLVVGPVPEEHQVDHICHSAARARGECAGGPTCPHRACQNPAHSWRLSLPPRTHAGEVRPRLNASAGTSSPRRTPASTTGCDTAVSASGCVSANGRTVRANRSMVWLIITPTVRREWFRMAAERRGLTALSAGIRLVRQCGSCRVGHVNRLVNHPTRVRRITGPG